jgi:hypothetical protein
VAWLISRLKKAWRCSRRERALQARLETLSSEEYQIVRAYLSLNARDEIFIRAFLRSGSGRLQRQR